MPRFPGDRTRAARRAGTACSARACPACPYSGSPATGWPIASRCARIWCVRPVSSVTRSSVSSASARSVSKCVTAWCGSSVSVEIRVRTRRSRPSGASIVPRRAGGRPSTSARYSRVISRARAARPAARRARAPSRASTQQPGGVAVEPVHDAGALRIGPAGHAARQRLHERPVGVPVARVHDDAGRLVDHEQVLVLVGDPELRRRRRRRAARLRQRRRRRTSSPPGEHVALGLRHAVDAHEPGVDQLLRLRARADARGQEDVEPLARRLRRDLSLGPLEHADQRRSRRT